MGQAGHGHPAIIRRRRRAFLRHRDHAGQGGEQIGQLGQTFQHDGRAPGRQQRDVAGELQRVAKALLAGDQDALARRIAAIPARAGDVAAGIARQIETGFVAGEAPQVIPLVKPGQRHIPGVFRIGGIGAGIVVMAAVAQQQRKIVAIAGIAGVDLHCPAQRRLGLGQPAKISQRIAQIGQDRRLVGLQRQGAAITRHRRLGLALASERGAEIGMGGRPHRRQQRRPRESLLGDVRPIGLPRLVRHGEGLVRLGFGGRRGLQGSGHGASSGFTPHDSRAGAISQAK